jgi:hypothetical protein
MASQDDKFGHLLQPIRDLASNFNISIASELEEYLVSAQAGCFEPLESTTTSATANNAPVSPRRKI